MFFKITVKGQRNNRQDSDMTDLLEPSDKEF